jgi:hypothetical protein
VAVLKRQREEHDEQAADRAWNEEHGEIVASEQLDQKRGADRGDRETDTYETRDDAPLRERNLVRDHRHQRCEQCVEEHLREAPADDDDRNAGCERDHEDAERTAREADEHPGSPHPESRRGSVAHPAEERVGEDGQGGANARDQRKAVWRLIDPDERVHLQRQRDKEGGKEDKIRADERQREPRHPAPTNAAVNGVHRVGGAAGRRTHVRVWREVRLG